LFGSALSTRQAAESYIRSSGRLACRLFSGFHFGAFRSAPQAQTRLRPFLPVRRGIHDFATIHAFLAEVRP
jgi:hypothetical protein